MHTLRAHYGQAASTTPCRGALGAVSWCTRRCVVIVSQRARCGIVELLLAVSRPKGSPLVTIQKLYRDLKPMPRALRAASRVVSQRCITSLSHDMKFCIATHCSVQAVRPRAAARPAHRPTVSWPLTGCIMGPWRRAVGRIVAPCCAPLHACALACHDTIRCIVTQSCKMGSSPSSFPAHTFFFSPIFFSLFHLLEDHKKKILYIYIFHIFK